MNIAKLLIVLSLLLSVAAKAQSISEIKQDLQNLTAGDEPFSVLIKKSETLKIKGIAILIPDAGKQVISPYQMMFLRSSLAQKGWNTLLITPPAWAQSEQGWQNFRTELQARLEVTQAKADEMQGKKMLIAEGASAASLLQIYAEEKMPQPAGLVVLSPYLPDTAFNQRIPAWYGKFNYPLLDVYCANDNRWSASTVKNRATTAKQNGRLDFRQAKMIIPPPNEASQTWLTNQIHGFADYLGW